MVASVVVLWAVVLGAGVWAALRPGPGPLTAVVVMALGAAVFSWWSLRRGRHTALADARRRADGGAAIVLWKPGCAYCERLLHRLRGRDDIAWVNVWQDPEANRLVRELNGGDELTPTAIVGDEVLRNPSAEELTARLARGR